MQLTSAQSLLTTINDLTADVAKTDGELESAAYDNKRIGTGWDTWFNNTAASLMDLRDGVMQLHPEATSVVGRLRSEALDLSRSAGILTSGHDHGHTFGAGWDTTLDSTLATLRGAAQLFIAPAAA